MSASRLVPWQTPRELWLALEELCRAQGWVGCDWQMAGELTDLRQRRGGWVAGRLVDSTGGEIAVAARPADAAALADYLVNGVSGLWVVRLVVQPDWGRIEAQLVSVQPDSVRTGQVEADRAAVWVAVEPLASANGRLDVTAPPASVAVVTSPSADGYHDVAAVIEAAGLPVQLMLLPAAVGGPRAATEVARQLASPEADAADVVLLVRGGGGGREWADGEEVCLAVATCSRPVWSAIGHARDQHLVDRLAARSFASPAAAAEAVVALHRAAAATDREQAWRGAAATTSVATQHLRVAVMLLALVVVLLALVVVL